MSLQYEINHQESRLLGLNLLRINGVPLSPDELHQLILANSADITRWKFPATFTKYNHYINNISMGGEFSGAIRHLLFNNKNKPSITYNNKLDFIRYTASHDDKALINQSIEKCYYKNALGINYCPKAALLIDDRKQLLSMQAYFEYNFDPQINVNNYFFFAKKDDAVVGFCALAIHHDTLYCPLGGVIPSFENHGVFSDILLFSRSFARQKNIPKIHMGIRAENKISMHVFLKHVYTDGGTVEKDWVDYVYFLTKNSDISIR